MNKNPFSWLKEFGIEAIQIGSSRIDLRDNTLHIPEGKKKKASSKKSTPGGSRTQRDA